MFLLIVPVVAYFVVGAGCALYLTAHYVDGLIKGRDMLCWSLVAGLGWFLLIQGIEFLTGRDGDAFSAYGGMMVAVSFGFWIWAALLMRTTRRVNRAKS